jgi:hypothetical protein
MKIRKSGSLVLAFSLYWAMGTTSAAQTSYPMVCRGGGSMVIFYDGLRSPPTVTVAFESATHAAGTTSPGPGQCAWLDRPLNSQEPRRLLFTESLGGIQVIWSLDRGSADRLAQVRHGGAQTSAIVNALDGDLFYLHAYNDRNAHLRVTRFGP